MGIANWAARASATTAGSVSRVRRNGTCARLWEAAPILRPLPWTKDGVCRRSGLPELPSPAVRQALRPINASPEARDEYPGERHRGTPPVGLGLRSTDGQNALRATQRSRSSAPRSSASSSGGSASTATIGSYSVVRAGIADHHRRIRTLRYLSFSRSISPQGKKAEPVARGSPSRGS